MGKVQYHLSFLTSYIFCTRHPIFVPLRPKVTTNNFLGSTEIFDLSNPTEGWFLGPILPSKISGASIVNSDGRVILVGGNEQSGQSQILYEYTDEGWVELEQKLKVGRENHSPIFIPNDLLDC